MTKPLEAWKNPDFLKSPDARLLRIIAEYLEPAARFKKYGVQNTVVFWGSARILSPEKAKEALELAKQPGGDVPKAERMLELSKYHADAEKLAYLLTEWSKKLEETHFIVATGGGEFGIMEAANKGASKAGGKTVGLGISLPFEADLNPYITRELQIQFHYFFMRKFWMVYLAKAFIAFPGGFGTLDELSEILTLLQTQKTKKKMPVILYGSAFWNTVLNIDKLIEWGVCSPKDRDLYKVCDAPEEAFEYLKERLTELYLKN